jgi:hypothetical protein
MKTNLSGLPLIIAAITILSIANTNLSAQVTVGSNLAPNKGALLDLKTRQMSTKPVAGADQNNYTTESGGLLLPRVKLVTDNSLAPLLTSAEEASDSLKYLLTGLMVYNISTVGSLPTPSLFPAVYTWNGEKWTTSQINEVEVLIPVSQPAPFTFCESGGESVTLTFDVNGGVSPTYQWFQITSTNVHVHVGDSIKSTGIGTGYQTKDLTLGNSILRGAGTTKDADYCGFYKFYCVVTDAIGQRVQSDIAEVAIGCGAKNTDGSWRSFMCFNLGADNNTTIADQVDYSITFQNDSTNGLHTYIANEENEEKLYGSLFQWGRIADGHELRSVDGAGSSFKTSVIYTGITVAALDSGNLCTASDTRRPLSQIKKGTTWYGNFIHGLSNWNPIPSTNQTALDQLWRTTRFVQHDPCAHYKTDGTYQEFWNETTPKTTPNNSSAACTDAGTNWRTPTQEEWGAIYRGGTVSGTYGSAAANTWFRHYTSNYPGNGKLNITKSLGYEIRPDGKTATLFLPASGYRGSSNGSLYYQGTYGYYWSSSVTGTSAYNLIFTSGSVYPANSGSRAGGFALRCIKNT